MSLAIPNIYPVRFPNLYVNPNNLVGSIQDIIDYYDPLFKINGAYRKEEQKILAQINEIVESGPYTLDTLDQLIVDSRVIEDQRREKQFIDKNCREGYNAYLFYINSVIRGIKLIHEQILKGQGFIAQLRELLNKGYPEKELERAAKYYVDGLNWLDSVTMQTALNCFRQYIQYNNDTKQWDILQGEVDKAQLKNYDDYADLTELRATLVPYTDSMEEHPAHKMPIFRSLNLLNRLRYIHFYYKKIIYSGATDYLVFPNRPEDGYPCAPDEADRIDASNCGHLELFYIGYLVDKEGSLNAPATLLDVKVRALRANLELLSDQVSTLNVYLDFIAHSTDMINATQNGANNENKKRLPDAAYLGLVFLLANKMYCLFKDDNNQSFLVLENPDNLGKFILIPTDMNGKRFFLGEDGTANGNVGDGCVNLDINRNNTPYLSDGGGDVVFEAKPTQFYTVGDGKGPSGHYKWARKDIKSDEGFKCPNEIVGCTQVLKKSVKEWNAWHNAGKITTDVTSSWITTFNNKSEYINSTLENINTEITDSQTTINNYDAEASNIRKKVEEIYGKVIEKIPNR